MNCIEDVGSWDDIMRFVMIVLLPKPCGGKRPIGLFPTLIRVWMRARSRQCKDWERDHARDSVYGGPSMSAQKAAWQAAFQAEHTNLQNQAYLQSLLDIVKAFEKVQHHILAEAAVRHGYCMWILRLSLDAYRCPRAIGVDGSYSRLIIATCGVTAGAGHATIELRCLLLDMVDDGYKFYREIRFTFYVDDVSIETFGDSSNVHTRHAMAVAFIIDFFQNRLKLEVSKAKSGTIGSKKKLADAAVALDRSNTLKPMRQGKLLGAWGTGGSTRCTKGHQAKLKAAREKTKRVHQLRSAGVSTRNLVRATYAPAILYSTECNGLSDSQLRDTRSTVATAMSPPTKGKSTDAILYIADTAGGRHDPAFEAHAMPIRCWAYAWWQSWRSPAELSDAHGRAHYTLTNARGSIWHSVKGPCAATIATAWRIG
jgi:hypothetical protein